MFRYSGFGLAIHSDLELPDLAPGGDAPDVTIRVCPVPRLPMKVSMEEEIGCNSLSGAFQIRHGKEIVLDPPPDADPEALRIMVMGRLMARLLWQRGWLPLHASGVLLGEHAVLFLGASGAGKSTTAAAFHQRGHQVVADDVGAVRVIDQACYLRPAGARVRLLDDSRRVFDQAEPRSVFRWDKHTFDLTREELPDLLRVRRIYALEYGEYLRCEPIRPSLASTLLSSHTFLRRHRLGKEDLEIHLRDCSAVAMTAPVHRLTRTRSLVALPELVRLVENDITADA